MTGVIWLVQVLVYPNFRLFDSIPFQKFHRFHTDRITWVVAPVMAIELITGLLLCIYQSGPIYFLNFILVLITWILTGALSVPIHRQLENGLHGKVNLLIWSNWPRTITWTLRSSLWFWILHDQASLFFLAPVTKGFHIFGF